MESAGLDSAREHWQGLIAEHQRRRRTAFLSGASSSELEALDREYYLLIDAAFFQVQTAESLQILRLYMGKPAAL